tara:strand:- start:489 stop:1187 length:699 start_codon:yes stop_codon:yes gene_type:complete
MESFSLDREIARLILLQRIELITPFQKKIRKFFGRYFFTNFFSKYFINSEEIGKKYFKEMQEEYKLLSKYLDFQKKKFLSIGSGMCGLELIINSKSSDFFFSIIEKNYVSKKVKYGWDQNNLEGYNDISKLNIFLQNNGMAKNRYTIHDFDHDNLPIEEFDYIISLYSLDYHYDFNLYIDYFKKVLNENSILIFDTIRPEYFFKLFNSVIIIESVQKNVHSSKRILCKGLRF